MGKCHRHILTKADGYSLTQPNSFSIFCATEQTPPEDNSGSLWREFSWQADQQERGEGAKK